MKNKLLILSAVTLFLVLTLGMVSAWGPNTHYYIVKQALERSPDTLTKQIIENNWNDCLAGIQYPDVGIFEYYTNFKDYQALHNYNAVEKMLTLAKDDGDRAFIYCFKMHLAADAVSHNYYVPGRITSTKLPNYLVHPITELKIEGYYLDPSGNNVGNRLMENHAEYDWIVTQATGRDWSEEATKLNTIMGGGQFYDNAYTPKSVQAFASLQNTFYKVLKIVVPEKTGKEYIEKAIKEDMRVLAGETPTLDPSGEKSLRQSDSETKIWLYIISFVVIAAIFLLSFKFGILGKGRK